VNILKIVFLASDAMAIPVMEYLYDQPSIDFAALITQPDRPTGRGKKLQKSAVKLWAESKGITIFQPERLGQADVVWLEEAGVGLILLMAYGQLLPKSFLEAAPLGAYNFHVSILPSYRGASPVPAAIASGDRESGVTLMKMVQKMDAGPIVDVEKVDIDPWDTSKSLTEKLSHACIPLIESHLRAIASGSAQLIPQDDSRATYVRKLTKEDGVLDFLAPASVVDHRVRALNPWPTTFIEVGGVRLKVGRAKVVSDSKLDNNKELPGEVLGFFDDFLAIQTGEGVLGLQELQRPGGKMLPVAEFLRGFPIDPGTIIPSNPMPAFISDQPFPYRKKIKKQIEPED
tara:strand:+ start:40 stop:1071 length:1032 start_codon:yes stop_codon:yes gene_type:complete